ncbi:MAG: aspartate aminotransferase family protein [bacterium]|nr:aspartate aminotransferase family protein [bacterium]
MKLSSLTRNSQPQNIVVKKAKGVKFWDEEGKEYLDFCSQTLNLNLGNSPDIAKKAFLEQFEKYTFLSTRFTSKVLVDLANELINLAPKNLVKVNLKLTNGGDANESAFKRVRRYRKKPYILSFHWSHLGESCETLNANGKHSSSKELGGSGNFIHLQSPFCIRDQKKNLKDCEKQILQNIEFLFKERDDVAGFIIEPIMVNAGGLIFGKNFLKEIRILCTKYDISLIFDEIQTGFGWLGKFFASDYYEIEPDLLTLGKGLASGFPLSAVLMKKEYDVLEYGEDEFTHGGHPISCAIALENIKFLKTSNILKEVMEKSEFLKKMLLDISRKYKNIVKEVRICGLIASVEFFCDKDKNRAVLVYDKALKKGLVLRRSLDGKGPSLVLKPPIIVSYDEISKAIKILEETFKKIND